MSASTSAPATSWRRAAPGNRVSSERGSRTVAIVGTRRSTQPSTVVASTAQISGRFAVMSSQDTPSSVLCQSCPVLVPKVMPTGSSESLAMASRSTLR